MATLDEISKEKQRVSEALARVDAQREKLTGQLGELEATERVLARYRKDTREKKTASPEPCWRRHRAVQTGWPHRRARREALRHASDGDGATRRGLTPR